MQQKDGGLFWYKGSGRKAYSLFVFLLVVIGLTSQHACHGFLEHIHFELVVMLRKTS